MVGKIYYQDISSNFHAFDNEQLVLDKEKARFICLIDTPRVMKILNTETFCTDQIDKESVAEAAFKVMQDNSAVKFAGHSSPLRFKSVGHTSMSMGDYIEFEDGEIWIAAATGWKIIKAKETMS